MERLLRLVYPLRARCVGCESRAGNDRDWLCEDCRRELASRWIGAAQPPEGGWFDGAAYGFHYGGPASGATKCLKYQGAKKLAEPMARQMLRAFDALRPLDVDCVTAVPMHKRRQRQRGYNHAALLAEQVAAGIGVPFADALERLRDTPQQARLDAAQRRENLNGAIAARGDFSGKRVLLVDDVCTTGATANACARALREAGAAGVYLLCFARAGEGEDN